MSDEQKKIADIVTKCWSDPGFKKRFLTDPKGVLAEQGLEVEPGYEIKVVEDTENMSHIVLPPAPPKGELSDDELGQVAGGATTFIPIHWKWIRRTTTLPPPH